jgi:hypothetical protein
MHTTIEVAETLRTTAEALRQQRKHLGPGPWIRPGREALLHGDDLRRYLSTCLTMLSFETGRRDGMAGVNDLWWTVRDGTRVRTEAWGEGKRWEVRSEL